MSMLFHDDEELTDLEKAAQGDMAKIVPEHLAKVGGMTPDDKVLFKGSIFDFIARNQEDPATKIPESAKTMFDVGEGDVKELLHELWNGYLQQVAEASMGAINQEIVEPQKQVLVKLQTAYKELLHANMTEDEDKLMRAAFDAVKAMKPIGTIEIGRSINEDPRTGESVGYHKLIRTRLRVEGDESNAQVDLSRIDPEGVRKAKSHAQLMQESKEAAMMAMRAIAEHAFNAQKAEDNRKMLDDGVRTD